MEREIDLIAAIYDAASDPSRWDEVVKGIVEATKSLSGNFLFRQPNAGSFTALYNVDPFFADAYVQTYQKSDPLRTLGWDISPGEVRACSYTQTESFRASAYYNEFGRPQGWVNLVAVGLVREPNALALLVLTRSPAAASMDSAEWRLLETVAPHLQRAAKVHQILSRASEASASLGAAAAAAGFAIFLLNADCRVLFANSKAEDLARRQLGLRVERGRLRATNAALSHHLDALARRGARPAHADAEIGGTIELSHSENHPPLLAHVIPVAASRTASIFAMNHPAVVVFVVDPGANLDAAIQRFAARFGLTGGETRLLGELIGGNGLLVAATKLKIAEATARTHARRIFHKTETRRQSELIRRFFETASLVSPPSA